MRFSSVVLLLAALLSTAAEGQSGGPEWKGEIDVVPLARTVTLRRPLSFAPFAVSEWKQGWTRSESSSGLIPFLGSVNEGRATTTARQHFKFVMTEDGAPRWAADCSWLGEKEALRRSMNAPTATGVNLECLLKPTAGGEPWRLSWEQETGSDGVAREIVGEGKLARGESAYRVLPAFTTRSRLLGDIAGGYVIEHDSTPIAAIQTRRTRQFTTSRDIPAEDRSLFAAAMAALVLTERASGAAFDD